MVYVVQSYWTYFGLYPLLSSTYQTMNRVQNKSNRLVHTASNETENWEDYGRIRSWQIFNVLLSRNFLCDKLHSGKKPQCGIRTRYNSNESKMATLSLRQIIR
jgi:hypothetical protein